jgi:hypothetical protein
MQSVMREEASALQIGNEFSVQQASLTIAPNQSHAPLQRQRRHSIQPLSKPLGS